MKILARFLMICVLTLAAGPRVMAADGASAVICASDGSRRVVVFDFETGKPAEQQTVFETCADCVAVGLSLAAEGGDVAPHKFSVSKAVSTPATYGLSRIYVTASARAPPLGMIT